MRTVIRLGLPVLIASAALLSACGSSTGYGNPGGSGLSTATVTGAFGQVPTVQWKAVPDYPSSTVVSTVITGTGPTIPADHTVFAKVYVSDAQAVLQQQSLCAASAAQLTAPGKTAQNCSTTFPLTSPAKDLVKVLQDVPYQVIAKGTTTISIPATSTNLFAPFRNGAHIGSRVAGLMQSSALGALVQSDSLPSIGIGNHDAVLVVVDFTSLGTVDCPTSTATPTVTDVPAAQLPAVQEKGGKPTGLTFTGVTDSACGSPVRRAVIKQGTGTTVGLGNTVTVNYFGEVYKGKAAFDESFTKKPASLLLSSFVPGFAQGLNGLKVGTRVVLAIPASAAYGDQASGSIPPSSTLYFVVDIVSSK